MTAKKRPGKKIDQEEIIPAVKVQAEVLDPREGKQQHEPSPGAVRPQHVLQEVKRPARDKQNSDDEQLGIGRRFAFSFSPTPEKQEVEKKADGGKKENAPDGMGETPVGNVKVVDGVIVVARAEKTRDVIEIGKQRRQHDQQNRFRFGNIFSHQGVQGKAQQPSRKCVVHDGHWESLFLPGVKGYVPARGIPSRQGSRCRNYAFKRRKVK